jgi:transposase-like protein
VLSSPSSGGSGASSAPRLRARRVQINLADEDVARLVAAYESGARTKDLAAEFGIHRTTVTRIQRGRGIRRRKQPSARTRPRKPKLPKPCLAKHPPHSRRSSGSISHSSNAPRRTARGRSLAMVLSVQGSRDLPSLSLQLCPLGSGTSKGGPGEDLIQGSSLLGTTRAGRRNGTVNPTRADASGTVPHPAEHGGEAGLRICGPHHVGQFCPLRVWVEGG